MVSIKIEEILQAIPYLEFKGNKEIIIKQMISLDVKNLSNNIISWCSDKKQHLLKDINYGTYIISTNIDKSLLNKNCNYIIVENPRFSFKSILSFFFIDKISYSISKTAKIDSTVIIGKNVFIGQNVVVEKNCTIGNNVIINHNTVVFKDTIIGNNVLIGSNNTIGGVGFGYEKNEKGNFELIPHIGNVVLSNNVEIGNNTTIDRAVLGSTRISENVKIDNLVHIAHGVKIGKGSVIIANSMIAGSVTIGENSWIAPSSSILNKKTIGSNSFVGIAAVVIRDVNDDDVVIGNPARSLNKKNEK